jgi:leader peptidase (prepilin peptidase)/N-methyltransferase
VTRKPKKIAVLWGLPLLLAVLGMLACGLQPTAVAVLYLAAVSPWLVTYDLREHRLPNALVLPGIVVGLVSVGIEWIASGRPPIVALAAGAGYAAFLLVMHAIGGMGMGDVKLGAALGLASWTPLLAVLSPMVAFLTGGIASVALLTAGRRGQRIAFGPFLLGGFWVAVAIEAARRL